MARGRGLHLQSYFAQLLAMLANCHRDPKKKRDPFRTAHFMPKSRRRRRRERRAEEAALDRFLERLPEKTSEA